jgi:hypothetical protein
LPLPLAPPLAPAFEVVVLLVVSPPLAFIEPNDEAAPLFPAAPPIVGAAPPSPTTTFIEFPGVTENAERASTAPPPPPDGQYTLPIPELPLAPPPTTKTSAVVTPDGTVQVQLPVEVNESTVYPPLVVEVVGEHAAAFAVDESAIWLGIPTTRERTSAHEIEVGRDLRRVAYVRRRISKITFTSLLASLNNGVLRVKVG